MLRAQASRPPARFFTLPKPRLRRYSATAALRTPWWQYTTISSAALSSSVLSSISSMGMWTAFSSRQSLVSQSWRTSRSTSGARSSRRVFSSAGVSSLIIFQPSPRRSPRLRLVGSVSARTSTQPSHSTQPSARTVGAHLELPRLRNAPTAQKISWAGPLVGEEDGGLRRHLDLDLVAQAKAAAHEGGGDHLDPDGGSGNADVVELA